MVQIRVSPDNFFISSLFVGKSVVGSGGIRTHAPEETGALNQRLRPLGHATFLVGSREAQKATQATFIVSALQCTGQNSICWDTGQMLLIDLVHLQLNHWE